MGTTRAAQRRKQSIEHILAAAWDEAARVGIGQLSLRSVAEAVGMKAPSLYVYFESKNHLYDAMFADAARDYRDSYRRAIDGHPVRDQTRIGLEFFLRFAVERSPRFQLLFQRPIPDFVPSAGSYAIAEEIYDDFVQAVRRQVDAGILSERALEPRSLDLITALAGGLAAQQIANEPGVPFESGRWTGLVGDVVELLEEHFEPTEER